MTLPPRLYHGTTAHHMKAILAGGLRPRGKRRSVDHAYSSHAKAVYLTDAFPFKFALDACERKGKPWALLILEVDTAHLDPAKLTVDDDMLVAQLQREQPGLSLQQTVRLAQRTLGDYANLDNAAKSLQASGSCAYLDAIPRAALTRAAVVHYEAQQKLCLGGWDVNTSPGAYALTKSRHITRLRWLFDNVPEPALANVQWNDAPDQSLLEMLRVTPRHRDGIEILDLTTTLSQ